MRPRVFPAEDYPKKPLSRGVPDASMRPRVFPAEDSYPAAVQANPATHASNEAAGIPRGRRAQVVNRALDRRYGLQ